MDKQTMFKKLFSLLPIALLASCATTAISPDYKGSTATIQETAIRVDSGKAQMFFLSKIDGKYISELSNRILQNPFQVLWQKVTKA